MKSLNHRRKPRARCSRGLDCFVKHTHTCICHVMRYSETIKVPERGFPMKSKGRTDTLRLVYLHIIILRK